MPDSPAQREQSIASGIVFMLGGALCMVGLDVTAKWLLQTYSLNQLVFLRCIFSALLIFWYGVSQGGFAEFRTNRLGWHVLRSFLMAGSMFAFFHALRHIPLADVLTLAFAAPLIVTALSRPFLGEPVGGWRWAAVITGFVGVLVVLRPGVGVIHPAALYALVGAALYALLSLTARKLTATETTVSLSLYLLPAPFLIGAALSPDGWIPPDAFGWLMFALAGSCGGLAFIFMNAAFRRAPAAVIVPFEYTGLIWGALAGFAIWGEVPSIYTWTGAAIIIASGLFILFRETRLHRYKAQFDFPLQEAVAVDSRDD